MGNVLQYHCQFPDTYLYDITIHRWSYKHGVIICSIWGRFQLSSGKQGSLITHGNAIWGWPSHSTKCTISDRACWSHKKRRLRKLKGTHSPPQSVRYILFWGLQVTIGGWFSSLASPSWISVKNGRGVVAQKGWMGIPGTKTELPISPVLMSPDFDRPFIVHTNISEMSYILTNIWQRGAPGTVCE